MIRQRYLCWQNIWSRYWLAIGIDIVMGIGIDINIDFVWLYGMTIWCEIEDIWHISSVYWLTGPKGCYWSLYLYTAHNAYCFLWVQRYHCMHHYFKRKLSDFNSPILLIGHLKHTNNFTVMKWQSAGIRMSSYWDIEHNINIWRCRLVCEVTYKSKRTRYQSE